MDNYWQCLDCAESYGIEGFTTAIDRYKQKISVPGIFARGR